MAQQSSDKPWYASKTVWANLIALVAAVGTAFGLDLGLDEETQGTIVAGVMAVVNVILRLVTDKPIRRGAGGSGGGSAAALLVLPLAAAVVTGCAGMVAPETPAQRLAYAESQYTAAVNTAADLREQGVIGSDQAERIDPLIQRGDEALDLAWAALEEGRPDDALDYVRVINRAVADLRQRLQEERADE